MKILNIDDARANFLGANNTLIPLEKITKEDMLRLANIVLDKPEATMDDYDENKLKNHVHRVIYKSIYQKLKDLQGRSQEFQDQAACLFLDAYHAYQVPAAKGD